MNTDRFKFRVWDKENECYQEKDADFCAICYNGTLHCDFWGDGDTRPPEHVSNEDAIIEQCTGLKDKNGKLIYEGDVVLYEGNPVYVVWGRGCCFYMTSVWTTKQGGIKLINAPGVIGMTERFPVYSGREESIKVIGNIHEEKWGIGG